MTERPPVNERTDQDITDDVVACLKQVAPTWVRLWPDDSTLTLHVRDTLDDLEANAREHGYAATGCIVVEFDAEANHMTWRVEVGSRHFEAES